VTSQNQRKLEACSSTTGRAGYGESFTSRYVGNSIFTAALTYRPQAYKAVGESTEIPLTYYLNNVSATISLLQIMSEYDCTRIVYSSSATVYGTPPDIPIPEVTRLKAESPYGRTKVMCESIINDLCHCMSFGSCAY
jgi:UDP-glucose 4-epimerase